MRKNTFLTIWIALIVSFGFTSCNIENKKDQLPKDIDIFLSEHFQNCEISSIDTTKTLMDFDITLDDGTEIEFTYTGQWEYINLRKNDFPASLLATLPTPLTQYLQENYPNESIRKIEKKSFGRNDFIYRVTLQKPNDIELQFTKEGEIISDDPTGKRLPSNASVFIKKHYPNEIITSLVNDVDGDYNVTLENNTEIDFDRKGNWFDIKTSKSNPFPESFMQLLPKTMIKYIEKEYPEQYIRRIEKKSYGYRVKLNKPKNVELSFTKTGEFMNIDSKPSDNIE